MKAIIITFLLSTFCLVAISQSADIKFAKYPFDIEVLQSLGSKKDTIMPTFRNGRFQYVDVRTGIKISDKTFEIAYPFNGRNSAIVKSNGKYGIVDRFGDMLVAPGYTSFQLWDAPFRENFVSFDNVLDYGFDLQKGIFVTLGNGCAKPLIEKPCCIVFKNKYKYGVNLMVNGDYYNQRTLIASVFDTVYLVNATMAIGGKEGKMIFVDTAGKAVFLGNYEEVLMSGSRNPFDNPGVIGFRTGKGWEYYNIQTRPQLVLTSQFKCWGIEEIRIKNAFGIYKDKEQFHILYLDNRTSTDAYDWISKNGVIAINHDSVYIIGEDGIPFLYYGK